MPSLDQVTEPASSFPDGNGVSVWDLAIEEMGRRESEGNHCQHVEEYFVYLARSGYAPPMNDLERLADSPWIYAEEKFRWACHLCKQTLRSKDDQCFSGIHCGPGGSKVGKAIWIDEPEPQLWNR